MAWHVVAVMPVGFAETAFVRLAGADAPDPLLPHVAQLENLLEGPHKFLYVLRGRLEVEEVVVDDSLRVWLDRELAPRRVAPEKPADKQVAVHRGRRVLVKMHQLDEAQHPASRLDELEVYVVFPVDIHGHETAVVRRQRLDAGLLAYLGKKTSVVFHRFHNADSSRLPSR